MEHATMDKRLKHNMSVYKGPKPNPLSVRTQAEHLAGQFSPGSQAAKDAAFSLLRETMLGLGYVETIDILDSLTIEINDYSQSVGEAADAVAKGLTS